MLEHLVGPMDIQPDQNLNQQLDHNNQVRILCQKWTRAHKDLLDWSPRLQMLKGGKQFFSDPYHLNVEYVDLAN